MTKRNIMLAKLLATILIFVALSFKLDLDAMHESVQNVRLDLIVLLTLLFILQTLFLSLRWRIIVNTGRGKISFKKAVKVTFASLVGAYLFFGGIGGLLTRVWLTAKEEGISLVFAVGASLIDRCMTLLALVLLAAAFLPYGDIEVDTEVALLFFLLFSGFAVALLFFLLVRKFSNFKIFNSNRQLKASLKYMLRLSENPWIVLSILIISVVAQCTYFIATYFLINGTITEISLIALLAVLPMIALVASLPISIAGWGVREGAFVYGLGIIGISAENAFVISLQIGFCSLLAAAIVGVPAWFITRQAEHKLVETLKGQEIDVSEGS